MNNEHADVFLYMNSYNHNHVERQRIYGGAGRENERKTLGRNSSFLRGTKGQRHSFGKGVVGACHVGSKTNIRT